MTPDPNGIKRLLVDTLDDNAALGSCSPSVRDVLRNGGDVALGELEIDSLVAMEMCIAIELELGVSIVPDEVRQCATLMDVVHRIEEAMR